MIICHRHFLILVLAPGLLLKTPAYAQLLHQEERLNFHHLHRRRRGVKLEQVCSSWSPPLILSAASVHSNKKATMVEIF